MELKEELKLIDQAKNDIHAFNKLYERYFGKIFAFCLNRLGNRELAEDVTSQTFLITLEKIHDIDTAKGYRLSAWLYKVANNKIVDIFRKHGRGKFLNLTEYEGEDTPELSKSVEISEMQKKIALVLSRLKPQFQEVLTLKFYSELENEEIANVMNINKGNVAVTLHRAIKAFKDEYEKLFPESEIISLN